MNPKPKPPKPVKDLAAHREESKKSLLTHIPPSKFPQVQRKLDQMPPSQHINYLKAVLQLTGPKAAIKAFCLECMGYERSEIIKCTAPACPLYEYRPEFG